MRMKTGHKAEEKEDKLDPKSDCHYLQPYQFSWHAEDTGVLLQGTSHKLGLGCQ